VVVQHPQHEIDDGNDKNDWSDSDFLVSPLFFRGRCNPDKTMVVDWGVKVSVQLSK
jgi:hypothetical protein